MADFSSSLLSLCFLFYILFWNCNIPFLIVKDTTTFMFGILFLFCSCVDYGWA
jgi:hypothetical protein